jgi:hypothetical protein
MIGQIYLSLFGKYKIKMKNAPGRGHYLVRNKRGI